MLRRLINDPTCRAFLWTSVLRTPFWAVYGMLLFILYKDLNANPLQIGLFIAAKPIVALFSMYWSFAVHGRGDRLRANIVWATILGYLPFLFVPVFDNAWYLIGASTCFMLFDRGVRPAWMELLKRNISAEDRQHAFSYGSIFSYIGGGGFPLLMGWFLDHREGSWVWMFPLTAFVGTLSAWVQLRLATAKKVGEEITLSEESLGRQVIAPWQHAWGLLKQRSDFAFFSFGFFFGGAGLMLMQPALPHFFMDELNLSYTELAIALMLCKGVGFALTSPIWARLMSRLDIYRFSAFTGFLAALFPLGLVLAKTQLSWLFIAYLVYGVMQAGSELSWNLSGTVFARDEDSSMYTGINVVLVGVRGCIAPPLGTYLCYVVSSSSVLLLGGFLCLCGTLWLVYCRRQSGAFLAERVL